jgi:hypothetical protein
MLGAPRPVGTSDARVTDNPLDCEAVPNEKHNQRADCRTDKTRAFIRPIPAHALAEPRGNECTCNAKCSRDDKALRVIGAGQKKSGDNTGDEADDQDPKKTAHMTSEKQTAPQPEKRGAGERVPLIRKRPLFGKKTNARHNRPFFKNHLRLTH